MAKFLQIILNDSPEKFHDFFFIQCFIFDSHLAFDGAVAACRNSHLILINVRADVPARNMTK